MSSEQVAPSTSCGNMALVRVPETGWGVQGRASDPNNGSALLVSHELMALCQCDVQSFILQTGNETDTCRASTCRMADVRDE